MRHKALLAGCALCVLLASGCSTVRHEEPPLDDSTLVEVLVGLHLAEADSQLEGPDPSARDSVLDAHGIDEQHFQETTAYYAEHMDEYLKLYDRVVTRLTEERYRQTR